MEPIDFNSHTFPKMAEEKKLTGHKRSTETKEEEGGKRGKRTFLHVYEPDHLCDAILTTECGSIKCHLLRFWDLDKGGNQFFSLTASLEDEDGPRIREFDLTGKLGLAAMTAAEFRQVMDLAYSKHPRQDIAHLVVKDLMRIFEIATALDLKSLSCHFYASFRARTGAMNAEDLFKVARIFRSDELLEQVMTSLLDGGNTSFPEHMTPFLTPLLFKRFRKLQQVAHERDGVISTIGLRIAEYHATCTFAEDCTDDCRSACDGADPTHPKVDHRSLSGINYEAPDFPVIKDIFVILDDYENGAELAPVSPNPLDEA